MAATIAYVTADGKYLFPGDLYDLDSQTNLTGRRNSARAKRSPRSPKTT